MSQAIVINTEGGMAALTDLDIWIIGSHLVKFRDVHGDYGIYAYSQGRCLECGRSQRSDWFQRHLNCGGHETKARRRKRDAEKRKVNTLLGKRNNNRRSGGGNCIGALQRQLHHLALARELSYMSG